MQSKCPKCGQYYGYIESPKAAMVLSCGDTYCLRCISNSTINYHEFECIKCGRITANTPIFVNKLYYEMLIQFKDYQIRREYENPNQIKYEQTSNSIEINYDKKCLNPFCSRIRFSNQFISQLFCSKKCWQIHQKLYQ